MKRYLAPIIDAIFVLACLVLIPSTLEALHDIARLTPKFYFHMSIYATIFYPLACLAMLQKMSTSQNLCDGLVTLNRALWRWYSWPIGIIFWVVFLFHSTIMTLGPYLGDMVRGSQGLSYINTTSDKWLLGTAIAIFLITISFILIKITGFKFKRTTKKEEEPLSRTFKIVYAVAALIVVPIYLILLAALAFATPFYLYCIIWCYAIIRATSGKEIARPFPDTKPVRFLSNAVLLIYTVVLAFFFEELVAFMVSSNNVGLGAVLNTCFAMTFFYVPYRIFFGLYSGKSRLGWITFLLSLIIVFMQTLSQFAAVSIP